MNRLMTGTAAGLIATVPMTVAMELLRRGLTGESSLETFPPREVAMGLAAKADLDRQLDKPGEAALTGVSHFAFGGSMGGAYGVASPRLPLPPVVKGTLWGLAVWAGSYLGWLPAVGIVRPIARMPVRRNIVLIGAHLVWGATLGVVEDRLARHYLNPNPSTRKKITTKTRRHEERYRALTTSS